ncbi:MAG TPA: hypothetical protein VKS78_13115 [Roseiarcus sp.]|nr:hypothetical protein [Roseiarcus sp.]
MPIEPPRFTLGRVAPQPDGQGFSIGDRYGASIVTFSFATEKAAETARASIEKAIAAAISVHGHDHHEKLATETIPLDRLNASNDE